MHTTRREFLQFRGRAARRTGRLRGQRGFAATALKPLSPAAGAPKKAVLVSMLPKELSILDRFKLAKEVGFEATEVHTVTDRSRRRRCAPHRTRRA